jgi:hypothetical protein
MMQMLAAAGVPIQQDGVRQADTDNERGYFEWERIKQLPREPLLIGSCQGKAVKVVSSLLTSLPEGFDYRIVFLERRLEDVHASQVRMIERLGTRGGRLAPEQMVAALTAHRHQVYTWMEKSKVAVQKVNTALSSGASSPGAMTATKLSGPIRNRGIR